jgi:hypothetical protein
MKRRRWLKIWVLKRSGGSMPSLTPNSCSSSKLCTPSHMDQSSNRFSVLDVDDLDMNEVHDELWARSDIPTPMLLSKGNGNPHPRIRVMPQKQKVNKSPALGETALAIPLPPVAVKIHSDSKVKVHGSGRSMGENAASNPREPCATRVPAAKPWSPFWFAQRL